MDAVLDPQLTRGDRLVGQVLGSKGALPSIYTEIEMNYFLLRRLLGVKTEDTKQAKACASTMKSGPRADRSFTSPQRSKNL